MGLLEFTAQVEHHGSGLHVEPFQLPISNRRRSGPVAHHRFRVGDHRLVRLLLLELGRVLLVDLAECGAGGADGLGCGGQRGVVRGGGVVGAPHLVDEFVEFGEVGAGGGACFGGPCLGESASVLLKTAEVGLRQVANLAPAGDLLPVVGGVVVLEAGPHAVDVHEVPVGEAGGAAGAPFDHGSTTGPAASGLVGSVRVGVGPPGRTLAGLARARCTSTTRAAVKASLSA